MILRYVVIALMLVVIFTVSLAVSYEGFQISPNLHTQRLSLEDVLSTCDQMTSVLQSNDISYEQMIRLLKGNEINSYLNSRDIHIVEQCLQGKLPELSSYLIPQKVGFVEGFGIHDAKGKAKILMIEKNTYLRLESFEINYESKVGETFQIPELHVYLSQDSTFLTGIYLDKLKTGTGGKNYKLPDDVDLASYNSVLIFDKIKNEPFAKISLRDPSYIPDSLYDILDNFKTVDSPKVVSQIIYDRYGFFEGVDIYEAKGSATVNYDEDEGELKITNFEISMGDDLGLYLTDDGKVKKSGYWTLDSSGFIYISSGNSDEILRYAPDGTFRDVFVNAGSGGLALPTGITFGPDGNLYVSSGNSDEILRYAPDGTFRDVFVNAGSGGLDGPKDLTFGPDGNLYVSSIDDIFRFAGQSGKFMDVFIRHGSGGLALPTGITFGPDGNLYVSSGNSDEILRYAPDGTFRDVFVNAGSGGLDGPKDLTFSSNKKYLYVASFLTNEILRYDVVGNFVDNIVSSHNGQITNPKYLTFGPDGNLYVSSIDDIFRFAGQSGKFMDVFIRHGSGGLALPTGITFGPDGNLYVSSGNSDEILRYAPDGTFRDVFVNAGSGGLDGPKDLTFGPDGNLYVSSGNSDEILRYAPDGKFRDVFVHSDEVDAPRGITFGPDGNLYVVNSMFDEILRFDNKTGDFIDVFASGGGLSNPIDIAVDEFDFFYISSGNSDEILRYAPDGTFRDVFVHSDEVDAPRGITFGPDGNLYVVSGETNEVLTTKIKHGEKSIVEKFVTAASSALYQPKHIELYDNKICVSSYLTNDIHCYDDETGKSLGKLTVSFDRALISRENSIAGPDGELYVSDDLRNEILRYDGDTGLFSNVIINTENDQLRSPSYLTFGPDGNLYVSSDDKIFRFNGNNGNFIDVFISQNKAGLSNSQGLSFNENYLYVSSYDNNRILRYDSQNGMFIDEFIASRDNGLIHPIGNVLDNNGDLYVTSQGTNKILHYDGETGKFLSQIKLQNSPRGLFLGPDNIMYISLFDSNEVISYDLNSKQSRLLLTEKDGLNGPESLTLDVENHLLYVSSSMNDKIIVHDMGQDTAFDMPISSGDGILQKPKGLTMKDGILFISNNNNNEILRYDPQKNALDTFIEDTGGLIRPGGITFGPNSNLYVINKNDDRVYQYDAQLGRLLGVFTGSNDSVDNDPLNIGLRNIVFTKDGEYLFASNPSANNILVYDVINGEYVDGFFADDLTLNYPTELTLTPGGESFLVINYGDNTISSFTVSGKSNGVFVNPGNDGMTELREIRFGHDGNLYVMGGTYGDIFKYDGITGNYLGEYDNGGSYLGKIDQNILGQKYLLNEIDTRQSNIVTIYDHFLERPFAKIVLYDAIEIVIPLNVAWNSLTSSFDTISEPKIKSKEMMKNTGFFVGLNDVTAYGQALTKSVDSTSLITIENFLLDYDADEYISTLNSNNVFTSGPNLVSCIVSSESDLICDESQNSIELGRLNVNAGDNRYLLKDVDLGEYDTIVIYDKTSGKSLANVPLRDYGTLRISGESFVDWLYNDFAVVPMISIIMMIFPIIFDYTRGAFKILFFTIHFIVKKRNHFHDVIMSNKKITILIPAHNEELGIRESIESALATNYQNKEIIVIDDGSIDNTWIIANSFAEKGLIKLIHRDAPLSPAKSSKASALNHGINYATGDYVLCMDGDTKLDFNALKNASQYFSNDEIVAFSGNVKILAGDGGVENLLTKFQKYEYMIAIELGRRFTSMFQVLLVISGAFGIFKKDLIKDVHTFDKDTLTEDFDLTLKFRKTRGKIKFVPDSIAYTYCPADWSTWISQRNRWAYGQFQTLSKNKNILTSKFPLKDKISFIDMFILDVIVSLIFPIGLAVLGIISVVMFMGDNLHVLVYPLALVMSIFLILEIIVFMFATLYSGKYGNLKLIYLSPLMTFFYRPYLKMINVRAYLRAYLKRNATWD